MQVPQNQLDHRPIDDIKYFVIHHSVTAQDLDITQIASMEKASQGFVTVGYHCIVRMNPATHKWEIQEGRTLDDVPAAAYGLNEPSYDLCLLGNYQPDVPGIPTNQVPAEALPIIIEHINFVKGKCQNLQYLIGHRDVAAMMAKRGLDPGNYSTDCPGDLLYAQMHDLRVATGLHLPPELA